MHHAVFLASKASNIHNLQQAKSYFRKIDYSRYQDSALYTMNIGQADVVVGDLTAEKWLSQHPGTAILNTPPVPNLILVVSKSLPGATVFACNGPECWKSCKSAKVTLQHGYSKVYWFRGGYPEWKAAGLPVE